MISLIASGKGGTGKTSLVANITISVRDDIQILDCDVEESNIHLLLHPKIVSEKTVYNTITFDLNVTEAIVNGKTIIEYSPETDALKEIERVWEGFSA
ncbi:MAG: hypothetical protein QXU47_04845 [Candidatus Bathyarchaeia archaeon]